MLKMMTFHLLVATWYCSLLAAASQTVLQSQSHSQPHKVGIIGGGAGGSSTAYHLAQFAREANLPIHITLFESNDRIGGRTTTVLALDDERYPTELGGSIFVKVNQILVNATRDFGLQQIERIYQSTESKYDLGIWNGHEFVFTIANDDDDDQPSWRKRTGQWWDIVKLLWKYGLSPITTKNRMKETVGKFLKMYDEKFPFTSLNDTVHEVGLENITGVTGSELLQKFGISDLFAREIIQSSTRVNYAQNLGNIHGLGAMVCMAIEGAMAIDGGNWQIFDEAIKRSGADLYLNSVVEEVFQGDDGSFRIKSNATDLDDHTYDTVVLAAPYQYANVNFQPKLLRTPKHVDYVSLHVTLFTSPHRPSPGFFNLKDQDQVPDSIITTLPEDQDTGSKRGKQAVGSTGFWSISTLGVLDTENDLYRGRNSSQQGNDGTINYKKQHGLGKQYLYKIFSPSPVSAGDLFNLFNLTYESTTSDEFEPISKLSKQDITWHHVKVWNGYPYLTPTKSFESFRLDNNVWYTSAIESFISTMETSALSGRNIARLIIDQLRE